MIIFSATVHLAIGLGLGIILKCEPIEIILILIGSLLPDLDHPKSTLGRYNPFVKMMKHRGKLHTFMGCVLLSLPFAFMDWMAVPLVFLGCISHILVDRFSTWSKRKIRKLSRR